MTSPAGDRPARSQVPAGVGKGGVTKLSRGALQEILLAAPGTGGIGAGCNDGPVRLVPQGDGRMHAALAHVQPLAAAEIEVAVADMHVAVADAAGDGLHAHAAAERAPGLAAERGAVSGRRVGSAARVAARLK